MTILLWILVFAVSLYVLIKSSDFFIEYAEKIGLSLGIPPMVIGITLVALGTSLPELASSIASVFMGSSEIVVSNVMGSNITNVFLVAGVVCVIGANQLIKTKPNKSDTFLVVSSAVFLAWAIWDRTFQYWEGLVCVGGIFLYILLNIRASMKADKVEDRPTFLWIYPLIVVVAGFGIYFSAEYNIKAIIEISESMNVGTEIISSGAVALGTSLPELFVSISAIRKGLVEMCLGNIIGSNIFNIFGVMGVARMVDQLAIPELAITLNLPLMLAATVALVVVYYGHKLNRWIGIVLLCIYAFFLVRLVLLGL